MDFSAPPASDGPSATTQSQQSRLLFWGTMVSHQKGCVCGKSMSGCGCKGCKDAMRGLREVYIGGWKKLWAPLMKKAQYHPHTTWLSSSASAAKGGKRDDVASATSGLHATLVREM